jgi:hypothetical protein
MSRQYIDHSVYPDVEDPPRRLDTPQDKAEYLHRICAAWDFGVHPDPQTFDMLAGWREVFDDFPVSTSPAYHAMRAWFKWETVPFPAELPAPIPRWVHLDRLEGRGPDPCEQMI